MSLGFELSREPLQTLRVDAIGYGAKDTGDMGGGAAAAVLASAGLEILAELKSKLSASPRRVGDVIVTPSFGLARGGVRWVIHIVSIIKHTPDGAYCPQPERLRDGVISGLTAVAKLGARSVALSALGTGEGRVDPGLAARNMIEGLREFRRRDAKSEMSVVFSLPSYRDYEAFRSLAQSC